MITSYLQLHPRERECLGEGDAILRFGTFYAFNKSQQVPGVQIAPKETWYLDIKDCVGREDS